MENTLEINNPMLYYVDKSYLKFLHKLDKRVSVKYNNRVFAGIITSIEGKKYVIPLTSQTTQERLKNGKKKRSNMLTTFVREGNEEIANLLYNNMFPVHDDVIFKKEIDPLVDTYCTNEIRFIRKNWEDIQEKALKVYKTRYNKKSRNYDFFKRACCDFKKLEKEAENYNHIQKQED